MASLTVPDKAHTPNSPSTGVSTPNISVSEHVPDNTQFPDSNVEKRDFGNDSNNDRRDPVLPRYTTSLLQVPNTRPTGQAGSIRSPGSPFSILTKSTIALRPDSESGRSGITRRFVPIVWRSSCTASKWVNVLWPFVPVALALKYALPHSSTWIFAMCYVAMVPTANLIGFAGQELARKIENKVLAVIAETTLGSVVEVILFIALLVTQGADGVPVIRAAILGSILANILLCLGVCFIVGGIYRLEGGEFHDAISDVGSNIMLVAGMALAIPTAWSASAADRFSPEKLDLQITRISRATAIILLMAFGVYIVFYTLSHFSLYDDILKNDEHFDRDAHKDRVKEKLTFTECVVALVFSIGLVGWIAVVLVEQIHNLVTYNHISDAFVGLILIPLVEKVAEHLTAIDEAKDNQMNLALSHVLGSCIQTAMLNTPIVVIVGWCMDLPMSINFEIFDSVVLVLGILVVGGFLRDNKSNYLEGSLCVLVYVLIAVSAFYYPNPATMGHGEVTGAGVGTNETAGAAH